MKVGRGNILLLAGLVAVALASCESRNYDTGDGELSYMRADFGVMTTQGGIISNMVTDDGDTLWLGNVAAPSWAQSVDSTYRVLVYYNDYANRAPELIRATRVPTVEYVMADRLQTEATDPVGLERVWKSRNGKYINLGLALKTGQQDTQDNRQTLGIICDSVATLGNGAHKYYLRLYHAQNNVPEYYTSRTFLSLSLASMADGDEYQIIVNTYNGTVVKFL